jgi:hypothetical protein
MDRTLWTDFSPVLDTRQKKIRSHYRIDRIDAIFNWVVHSLHVALFRNLELDEMVA